MIHLIKKQQYQTTTPTGLYEANFRRLSRLIPVLLKPELQRQAFSHNILAINKDYFLSKAIITWSVRERYKYTSIISLKKLLNVQSQAYVVALSDLSSIDMELRICHDACLVEVIAYQGKSPILSMYPYPNKQMLQIDEKRQLNLFLKDVLERALKLETI